MVRSLARIQELRKAEWLARAERQSKPKRRARSKGRVPAHIVKRCFEWRRVHSVVHGWVLPPQHRFMKRYKMLMEKGPPHPWKSWELLARALRSSGQNRPRLRIVRNK